MAQKTGHCCCWSRQMRLASIFILQICLMGTFLLYPSSCVTILGLCPQGLLWPEFQVPPFPPHYRAPRERLLLLTLRLSFPKIPSITWVGEDSSKIPSSSTIIRATAFSSGSRRGGTFLTTWPKEVASSFACKKINGVQSVCCSRHMRSSKIIFFPQVQMITQNLYLSVWVLQ